MIERLKTTDTWTIVVGTDLESSKRAVELARKHKEIYACIGVHPVDEKMQAWQGDQFEELVKDPKVVAVGECGFDFYHAEKSQDFERQTNLFLEQINLAVSNDKPLMIHARDAYDELLSILTPMKRDYGDRLRGNVHFFAADKEIAKKFIDLGFTLSFTGAITFLTDPKKKENAVGSSLYDEVIKYAPLNMILSETDAPLVAPVPYRGKRNEPSYVKEVVKRIAEIRKEDERFVEETLVQNAFRVFQIPEA